jgi:hypothetical protein
MKMWHGLAKVYANFFDSFTKYVDKHMVSKIIVP